MAEKQLSYVSQEAKDFLEAFIRRQSKESYQNEFSNLLLHQHFKVVEEIRHKSSTFTDEADVTAQIAMDSCDGEMEFDHQEPLTHRSKQLDKIRKELNETPNSIDSVDSKTPMGTASSPTLSPSQSERNTPYDELENLTKHEHIHSSHPTLHVHSEGASSSCSHQQNVYPISHSLSATLDVSHRKESSSSSRHSSIPSETGPHLTHVDLILTDKNYPELEGVIHTEVKHDSLKREISKGAIGRSLSHGDVDSKNRVSSLFFIRPKKDSDHSSISKGSSACSRSGTLDKGYEADVDKKTNPKKPKSRGSSFFSRLKTSFISQSQSTHNQTDVQKLALDYLKNQSELTPQSNDTTFKYSTPSKSSSSSPDNAPLMRSSPYPQSQSRMSASSLPEKSESSIVRRSSNKVTRVSSLVGGNIQKLSVQKRAPLAEFEDFLSDDEKPPIDNNKVDNKKVQQKQKKKKKWYKSLQANRHQDNLFTRLFGRGSKTPRIEGALSGMVTSNSQIEESGYLSTEKTGGTKRRLSVPTVSTTDSPDGTSDATRTFSELLDKSPVMTTSTPKPDVPLNGEILLESTVNADRTNLSLNLGPDLNRSSGEKPRIVINDNNNVKPLDGCSPVGSTISDMQEQKEELVAKILDDIAKSMMGQSPSITDLTDRVRRDRKLNELLKQDQSMAGGRSRNVSGDSENTLRPRVDSRLTATSSCTDITVMDESDGDIDIGVAINAKTKRLKKYQLDEKILGILGFPETYESHCEELNRLLGARPGWRAISMLYFMTRRIIIYLQHQTLTDEELHNQIEVIKHYTLFYFNDKYSQWVETQGGWRRVIEESEDTDVD